MLAISSAKVSVTSRRKEVRLDPKISVAFTGGALGAFVDSFNIWFMGKIGISDLIGLSMKPDFTAPWLYQRMVWGGIDDRNFSMVCRVLTSELTAVEFKIFYALAAVPHKTFTRVELVDKAMGYHFDGSILVTIHDNRRQSSISDSVKITLVR